MIMFCEGIRAKKHIYVDEYEYLDKYTDIDISKGKTYTTMYMIVFYVWAIVITYYVFYNLSYTNKL